MKLLNILKRERIAAMQQFMSEDPITKERSPHIYILTNKRVVELDYNDFSKRTTVATLKQIKSAHPPKPIRAAQTQEEGTIT